MPAGGQNIVEHIAQKYGSSPQQSAANREMIRARAADVQFTVAMTDRSRIYNTFDAHRLLHWAELQGRHVPLKHELFRAYFTSGLSPADHDVLVSAAEKAGLDPNAAREILTSGRYAEDVRQAEQFWHERGVTSVPAVIINERHLISGGQSPDMFERALRSIIAEG